MLIQVGPNVEESFTKILNLSPQVSEKIIDHLFTLYFYLDGDLRYKNKFSILNDFEKDEDGYYSIFIDIELNDFGDLRKKTICLVSIVNAKSKIEEAYKQKIKLIGLERDMTSLEDQIKEAVKNAEDWKRIPTSTQGIFIVKPPQKTDKLSLLIELNPTDKEGNPTKRKGLFIKDIESLRGYKDLINTEKLEELIKVIDKIAGKEPESRKVIKL